MLSGQRRAWCVATTALLVAVGVGHGSADDGVCLPATVPVVGSSPGPAEFADAVKWATSFMHGSHAVFQGLVRGVAKGIVAGVQVEEVFHGPTLWEVEVPEEFTGPRCLPVHLEAGKEYVFFALEIPLGRRVVLFDAVEASRASLGVARSARDRAHQEKRKKS